MTLVELNHSLGRPLITNEKKLNSDNLSSIFFIESQSLFWTLPYLESPHQPYHMPYKVQFEDHSLTTFQFDVNNSFSNNYRLTVNERRNGKHQLLKNNDHSIVLIKTILNPGSK